MLAPMLTVKRLIPGGAGLASVLLKRAAQVALDWDLRQKSRFEAQDSQGRRLGVFLPRGTVVRGGDVLVADDGSLVHVQSAPQAVLEVRACPTHGSPFDLMRAAYHLGNRHVPLALQPDCLRLEPDPVLADLLRKMHLIVTEAQAAFEPEGGAYGAGALTGHAHGHGHDHDHAHDHAHGHAHAHAHGNAPAPTPAPSLRGIPVQVQAAAPHVHGPNCGHDHGHGHAHGHDHGHPHGHDH